MATEGFSFNRTKDPDATKDYVMDWSDWLEDGDTIDSHEVIVSGVELEQSSNTDETVTAWVSGGTQGRFGYVTYRVTTTGGRVDDRTLLLEIRNL